MLTKLAGSDVQCRKVFSSVVSLVWRIDSNKAIPQP